MKRRIVSFLALALAILFAGCANNAAPPPAPLEEMPTVEELKAFRETHTDEQYKERLLQVKELIDGTSHEDVCASLRRSLEEWAEAQTSPAIDRVAIEFSQDPLLMDEQRKQKAYQNMDLKVEIYYDAEQVGLTQEQIAQRIADPAMQVLRENPYGWARIKGIELTCYNLEHRIQYGTTSGNSMSPDFMVPVQPEEELKIQKMLYYSIEDWNSQIPRTEWSGKPPPVEAPNVTLRHFGIKPDTGELYMEIPIYLYDYNMSAEEYWESLAGRSEELYRSISGDGEAAAYLKKSGVHTVTVEFYTPWAQENHAVYSYPLE